MGSSGHIYTASEKTDNTIDLPAIYADTVISKLSPASQTSYCSSSKLSSKILVSSEQIFTKQKCTSEKSANLNEIPVSQKSSCSSSKVFSKILVSSGQISTKQKCTSKKSANPNEIPVYQLTKLLT